MPLECLAYSDEILQRIVLRRAGSGHRIQILAQIEANGTDRRGVAQPDANIV